MEGVTDYSGPEPTPQIPGRVGNRSRKTRRAFTGFGVALLFDLFFVIFFRLNFTTVVVSGQSMLPTLTNGKKVLVSKAYWLVGRIQDGDVIVIKQSDDPGDYIIKRVYKMAGETVDTYNAPASWSLVQGAYTVPEERIYVLGDNRAISEDSRRFGAVPIKSILGKVVAY